MSYCMFISAKTDHVVEEHHTVEPSKMQKCSVAVMPSAVAAGHVWLLSA